MTVSAEDDGSWRARTARISALDRSRLVSISGTSIGLDLDRVLPGEVELISIPPIDWPALGKEPQPYRTPVTVFASVLMAGALLLTFNEVAMGLAVPIGALVFAIFWAALRKREPLRFRTAGDLHLDGSNLVDYALARRRGERPEIMTRIERRGLIQDRIDAVREEYGRLAGDIVYRIGSPALFDATSPLTGAFENALVRATGATSDLTVEEFDDLATELEISFAVARDHAETLAMGHLPEAARPDARRAAKAAQLAAGAATDGEREAALAQVVRILDSLALHYLPAPEAARRALTTGATSAE